MTFKRFLVFISGLFAVMQLSFAAEKINPFAEPMPLYKEGSHYVVDYPDAKPKKPTVVEFFSFGCPHCSSIEPQVQEWLSKKPSNVNLIKVPVSFGRPEWTLYAKAYYISKALKVEDKFTVPFFKLIHVQKRPPATIADVKRFFLSIGVSSKRFDETLEKDSFYIESSIKKADQLARKYRVAGVPDFLINYKYRLGKEISSEEEFHSLLSELALKDFN